MKDIKFRAWDGSKMSNDFLLSFDGEILSAETFPFTVRKDCVLMQYTGLKDKNGKEIYEGDICSVLYTDWPSQPAEDARTLEQYLKDKSKTKVVHWDFNGFYFSRKIDGYSEDMNVGKYGFIEVIGNRFENPEFLETEE